MAEDTQSPPAAERPQHYDETPEEHADHEAISQHELQDCIDAVIAQREGRSVAEIHELLAESIARAGHRRPPKQWLLAVSQEIAGGRRYITGTHADGSVPETHQG